MAFCYFSLWAPGRMAKLQSDISVMISPDHYRRFVVPFIRAAVPAAGLARCITSTECQPFVTSTPCWRSRNSTRSSGRRASGNRRVATRAGTTSIAGSGPQASRSCPAWVEVDELAPLLDAVGPDGVNVLMHFTVPGDIDEALKVAERYR